VKTLHPKIFGGILGRRSLEQDRREMQEYEIPEIDLVIVDLYPFEETVASTNDEKTIIEKVDIGGPSMIRAAAKNFQELLVVASREDYSQLHEMLAAQQGHTSLEQRKAFAARAFAIVAHYDVVIAQYFNPDGSAQFLQSFQQPVVMRYGENPHQQAVYFGALESLFTQKNGKELSYNNLVDVDAAMQLISEFKDQQAPFQTVFAIIKHTNVCGIAARSTVKEAWDAALAGDPESAFGGVLVCNKEIDAQTAEAIQEIFFEVLIAPSFDPAALDILSAKKNRILLQQKEQVLPKKQFKSLLNGVLQQSIDEGNTEKWEELGGRTSTDTEKQELLFANLVCKHLKSNAIALVKNHALIGKGCGQTSRIDALRQSLEKARQFGASTEGAVMASDAFFPFDDCVRMGHEAGIHAFIQPGGSIRDKDSVAYCQENKLVLVMTGRRHFRH
jgi:phosphoribosylaminoimidazolecarboxamide formyltransferase / IMP cyclohydrolase